MERTLFSHGKPRQQRTEIKNGEQFALEFGVPLEEVEAELQRREIKYHKDSQGNIYA